MLVTGDQIGHGASTVCSTLQGLNKPAFDSDFIEGLAGWLDLNNHATVTIAGSQSPDIRKFGKFWSETVLQDLLSTHKNLVLCGEADNQLNYYRWFDGVIVLDIPPHEQARHLHSRAEHDYDNNPELVELIIRKRAQLLSASRSLGATIMNANRPVRDVSNDIIRHLK